MDALRFATSFLLLHLRLEGLELLLLFPYGLQENSEGVERSSKGPAYIMQCQLLILLPFTPSSQSLTTLFVVLKVFFFLCVIFCLDSEEIVVSDHLVTM
jgi:hypothetical protein